MVHLMGTFQVWISIGPKKDIWKNNRDKDALNGTKMTV